MAFMTPAYDRTDWIEVEGRQGTYVIPADIVGLTSKDFDDDQVSHNDDDLQKYTALVDIVEDYQENSADQIETISFIRNKIGVRLSASGYMDCTDWSIFDTENAARDFVSDFYEVDPDNGDELDYD